MNEKELIVALAETLTQMMEFSCAWGTMPTYRQLVVRIADMNGDPDLEDADLLEKEGTPFTSRMNDIATLLDESGYVHLYDKTNKR